MRMVAVTDIHGRTGPVHTLVEKLGEESFDVLLIAGDITNFSGAETARKVLEPLLSIGKPVLAVHGNCDGRDVPAFLERLGIGIHGKRVEVSGVGFVGVGGSNVTPFNTIWELSEEEIEDILENNYREGDVILSHVPPRDTKADRVHAGLHVGSSALRRFIEREELPLVVTGHIHEARSVDRLGPTVIVNPGPLFRNYYAIVDFDEKKRIVREVELEKF